MEHTTTARDLVTTFPWRTTAAGLSSPPCDRRSTTSPCPYSNPVAGYVLEGAGCCPLWQGLAVFPRRSSSSNTMESNRVNHILYRTLCIVLLKRIPHWVGGQNNQEESSAQNSARLPPTQMCMECTDTQTQHPCRHHHHPFFVFLPFLFYILVRILFSLLLCFLCYCRWNCLLELETVLPLLLCHHEVAVVPVETYKAREEMLLNTRAVSSSFFGSPLGNW